VSNPNPDVFHWPDGRRGAVSLTFDDARASQLEAGLPVLESRGARATFYLSPPNAAPRREAWRQAAARGHEMGNHTLTHPCSGNFAFARGNPLEDYTLERMREELAGADDAIAELAGVTPATFAYPCGQKFVGRGEGTASYIPLVARRYLVGRGFGDEDINAPLFCDLAQATGIDGDDAPFATLRAWVDRAAGEGGWLILACHDVGDHPRQAIRAEVLDAVCGYCNDPGVDVWLDTVAAVGRHIAAARRHGR
jgi:peptidoglycan/xylan/chitin deacetylase (PgdA/CDA1 family)